MAARWFMLGAIACLLGISPMRTPAQSIEQVLMPGAVSEAHAKAEKDCRACHKLLDKRAQPGLCLECHDEVEHDIDAGTGFHGRLPRTVCADCHIEHDGRDADITVYDLSNFEHRQTDFLLYGRHNDVECRQCHEPGKPFREAPAACIECHREDDVHTPPLGEKCGACHTERGWDIVHFDHGIETEFALRFSHERIRCTACHEGHDYHDTPTECVSCHREDDHHDGKFGEACGDCHVEREWNEIRFDHDHATDFPLEGRHRPLACDACHTARLSESLETDCVACHAEDDVHDRHLGDRCGDCHAASGWTDMEFEHERHTGFALTGAHREPDCAACHEDMKFRSPTPKTCNACHADDDMKRGHRGRFGVRCATCHVSTSWKRLKFDHARDTEFHLRGAHRKVRCTGCHEGNLYRDKLDSACVSCHEDDDEHDGHLGRACGDCHVAADWKESTFDHAETRFPLDGKHRDVKCHRCHANDRFWETGLECIACHRDDDAHDERLGPRCNDCHDASRWTTSRFDHDRDTDFELSGAHERAACVSCHRTPIQGRIVLDDTCYSCHKGDDVHFGTMGLSCAECHRAESWRDVDERAREWAKSGGPPRAGSP